MTPAGRVAIFALIHQGLPGNAQAWMPDLSDEELEALRADAHTLTRLVLAERDRRTIEATRSWGVDA